MKTLFTSFCFVALVALVFVPSGSFAQTPDTVIVSALPPGNLNTVINADTLAGGLSMQHPNRVWLLKPIGAADTIYFLTATLRVGSLNLVGVTNPKTGHPPVIGPFILSDNSSPGNFITITGPHTLYCKNIYFLGTRTDESTVSGTCMITVHDSSTFKMDHCVFENFGSSGTPNLFYTQGVTYQKLFITNCMFRNNQDDVPQNPGFCWLGNPPIPMDTAIFRNNTWFVNGGAIIGGSPYVAYELFDHNTVFNLTKSPVINQKQMYNAYITNNVFYNVFSMGQDSVHVYNSANWNANYYGTPAIITVFDSLINFAALGLGLTDSARNIQINHNAYFWSPSLVAAWPDMSAITRSESLGGIVAPRFCSSNKGMIFSSGLWLHVAVANNDSVDPGFNTTLAQTATDNLINFDKLIWQNGASGGYRPFINPMDPANLFAGVAANWNTTQGYPVPENLRYSNTALQKAGSDGEPLGDLNWFPEFLAVAKEPGSIPASFSLSQNYPNPFNPSTTIKYSIPQSGLVTLKVYNILGQEVATLVNQQQKPGNYNVSFDGARLASGVYIYRIESGNFSMAIKMLLLK